MGRSPRNVYRNHRASMPTNIMPRTDPKKNIKITKSIKLHRSFTENDLNHPLIIKKNQEVTPMARKLSKAHSSKGLTEKPRETHIKKYKLKKKTFTEMKELLKDFTLFYKELKKLVANVIFLH